MTQLEIRTEALTRATEGTSTGNYRTIFNGFIEKGILAEDIIPRENVLTFQAWKAKGRHVIKGQHGIRINTYIKRDKKELNEKTGDMETKFYTVRKCATVFHISQTAVFSS